MVQQRLGASLLLLAILGPAGASAAPPLVVLPNADPPPAFVRKALGTRRPLSRAQAWRTLRAARARLRLEQARRAAEAGRVAVTKLRLEPAKRALREALGHFAAAQPLPEACRGARDTARDLAFLHWQSEELGPARRWRAAAAGLAAAGQTAAAAAIDPTRYAPEFIAFWRASDDNPGAIQVTVAVKRPDRAGRSAQIAAEAWVNCKAVGKTPAAISVKGAALVALAIGPRAAGVVVEPDRSELVEVPLTVVGEEPTVEDASALLQATGAAALLWVRPAPSKAWVIDRFTAAGGWQRPHRRFTLDPAPGGQETARPRTSGRSTLLGWTLTGFAAAALVAGVVTATLAEAAADEIERKAAAEEVFDPADEEDNRRFSTASYATLAVGGALAAGAAAFWLWRARRGDTRPPEAGLALRGAGVVLRW